MKQRTRKLLTLLLIAAMVMSLMVPALAADTAQSEPPTLTTPETTPSARSRTRTARPASRTAWSITPATARWP